jgi:fibronectin type 3 domain-containing protein
MQFLTPRHALGLLLTLALFFCVTMAYAGSVTLTWTNPTTRTDGSTLSNLASVKVYRASTAAGLATAPVLATVPAPATSYVDATAPAGTWHYAITAVDANGLESAKTASVSATVPVAPPA